MVITIVGSRLPQFFRPFMAEVHNNCRQCTLELGSRGLPRDETRRVFLLGAE